MQVITVFVRRRVSFDCIQPKFIDFEVIRIIELLTNPKNFFLLLFLYPSFLFGCFLTSTSTLGWIGIIFATVALTFGLYANFSCDSVYFPTIVGDSSNSPAIVAGMWGYRTTEVTGLSYINGQTTVWYRNTCSNYDTLEDDTDGINFQFELDERTKTLQMVAVAIAAIGSISLLLSCLSSCLFCGMMKSSSAWKIVSAVFLLCCILQGCSLLLIDSTICTDNPVIQFLQDESPNVLKTLQNPYQCERTYGYNLNITSVVFWFCSVVLTFLASSSFPKHEVADANTNSAATKDLENNN
jgi:hypothetical protein